ncbi:phosphatidylinositol-specific phospholipase C [Catenuloplanes sp. NPDC051500]|uniref:phosphatidylinositol-specific phospholipase C n=1 Tax=Catenuloplanes sp. NPDC051500 TaxID=3363959 RepID=UPI0037B763F4
MAFSALGMAVAAPASAHTSEGYSHDSTIGLTNTDWMSALPGTRPLSELSVPATHDTGASRAGGDIALTQSMSLSEQLKSGIRGWDVRLGMHEGRLKIYHGIALQGQDFDTDVLATATTFLAAHPRETVLMRIAHETGNETNFGDLVKAQTDKYPRIYTGASDNPALDAIRGKIVILQSFSSSRDFGIPWSSLAIQDNYQVNDNWGLAKKWSAIKGQLDASRNGPKSKTYVNFLSGSGGSFPYFVASGHSSPGTDAPNLLTGLTRGIINTCGGNASCIAEFPSVNCFWGTCSVAFEGTNVLTMNELRARGHGSRAGLVYADFPGRGLIQAVIDAN